VINPDFGFNGQTAGRTDFTANSSISAWFRPQTVLTRIRQPDRLHHYLSAAGGIALHQPDQQITDLQNHVNTRLPTAPSPDVH
jgi:hypothetical protein